MAVKNIIFDWSGVISDDHRAVYETCIRVFERFNVPKISYEEFTSVFELPYMNFYRRYLDQPAEVLEEAYTEESEHVQLPSIYPEVKAVLDKLKKDGYYMTIFSSMSPNRLKDEMEHMGVMKIFSNPRCGIRNKVEAFQEFVSSNGFSRDNTLYVGDMVHDIHAAKSAGIMIAAMTRGYDSRDDLEKEAPEFLIDDLTQLFGVLEKLKL